MTDTITHSSPAQASLRSPSPAGSVTAGPGGGRHAVVIGGSMAGLLAARVLADHFDQVTLVERDELPQAAQDRKGVPQGRHLHGLLKRGEDILGELFPGLLPELHAQGAVPVEFGREFHWHHHGVWKTQVPHGIVATCLSRPLLEAAVRRRVFALPGVHRKDGHDVKGLTASADRRAVTGVVLQPRDGTGQEVSVRADLVVDASGRGSSVSRWLESIGYQRPEESVVKVHVGYASRTFRRPPPSAFPWKGLFIVGTPPQSKRLGVLVPIEGDRWIATLGGILGDYPPDDEAGFLAFAKSLPADDLYRAFQGVGPLSDIVTYRFPSNLRRRFERMQRFPDGLVALGDSACSFNPIYGQGMSVAAIGALTLDGCLKEQRGGRGGDLSGLSRRFQRALARVIDAPWAMTTGEDLRHPEVAGERPLGHSVMQWYTARIHQLSGRDPDVLMQFLLAMHMLVPPTRLFHPRMLLRVLRG